MFHVCGLTFLSRFRLLAFADGYGKKDSCGVLRLSPGLSQRPGSTRLLPDLLFRNLLESGVGSPSATKNGGYSETLVKRLTSLFRFFTFILGLLNPEAKI